MTSIGMKPRPLMVAPSGATARTKSGALPRCCGKAHAHLAKLISGSYTGRRIPREGSRSAFDNFTSNAKRESVSLFACGLSATQLRDLTTKKENNNEHDSRFNPRRFDLRCPRPPRPTRAEDDGNRKGNQRICFNRLTRKENYHGQQRENLYEETYELLDGRATLDERTLSIPEGMLSIRKHDASLYYNSDAY